MRGSGHLRGRICLLWVAIIGTSCAGLRTAPTVSPSVLEVTPRDTIKTDVTTVQTSPEPLPTYTVLMADTPESPGIPHQSALLGLGLRKETEDILVSYQNCPGMLMTANFQLAEEYFPQLEGWIRTLGGPSLEVLQTKSARAYEINLDYEGLSYGLETSQTTPAEEWMNVEQAAEDARAISDQYGKQLVLGPGLRLMIQNDTSYPVMAASADIWMIQTQRLQELGPGAEYRQEVDQIIQKIHQGNPEVRIWAQIVFPPDSAPDVQEWLAFRDSISDLVAGTYIGVYNWDTGLNEQLQESIRLIFEDICPGQVE